MRTKYLKGIKNVEIKIEATGYGVVNWNGSTPLKGVKGKDVSNHSLPKLRGFYNKTGEVNAAGTFEFKFAPTDIDFKKTPMYIGFNCIRFHLFRDNSYDSHFIKGNILPFLASLSGLVRGYMVPDSSNKRASCLLIEDFIETTGNGNFEQFTHAGTKEKKLNKKGTKEVSNALFSKTTFGDTAYVSYGSINLEQLQFISLDHKFDRSCMDVADNEVENVRLTIENSIKALNDNPDLNPVATFHKNYVRNGTVYEQGENGILLNDDAMEIIINEIIDDIKTLSFRQAKGYVNVNSVTVDYNDSHKIMRIKHDEGSINEHPSSDFATYFYQK